MVRLDVTLAIVPSSLVARSLLPEIVLAGIVATEGGVKNYVVINEMLTDVAFAISSSGQGWREPE